VQGSLLRVRFDQRNVLLFSGPAHERERRQMSIRTSRSNGAAWRTALTLSPNPAAYSDLVQVNRNIIGLLFETGAKSPYETIVFRRIHLNRIASM
jgi:sialidase-1